MLGGMYSGPTSGGKHVRDQQGSVDAAGLVCVRGGRGASLWPRREIACSPHCGFPELPRRPVMTQAPEILTWAWQPTRHLWACFPPTQG